MTDEETKRSCYTCQHQNLCYLRRRIYDALLPSSAWMLEGMPRTFSEVFDVLAQVCNQYESGDAQE